jgi:two-component system LytT family response regulator
MIDTVIIDDERHNIDILSNLVKQFCPGINVLGDAANGIEGAELIKQQNPQLVFLDIEMPFGNAFDLLDKLAPVSFDVVFVTAFDQYAIRAFEYAALDYLLKPVRIEKLKQAVERVEQRLREKSINTRIDSLLANLRIGSPELTRIALPVSEGVIFEETNNMVHLEAKGNYTSVLTRDQKKRLVTKSLKEFEDILPPSVFCRLHHSHIVNLNYIKKYYKGRGGYVELENGNTVEVSSRKRNEFFEKFGM